MKIITEDDNYLEIENDLGNGFLINIEIEKKETSWCWSFYFHNGDEGQWIQSRLCNGIIDFGDEEISIAQQEIIEKQFLQLLKEIKEDKSYRLKLINRLDEQIRHFWNQV